MVDDVCLFLWELIVLHSTKKPVTTMLTYPWKCTVLHCNHLGNAWKPLVLMTQHFDYCPSASEGDNQSVGSSAPVVSRRFPGGYNVKLYISRGRLAWWLLAFLHSASAMMTAVCFYGNSLFGDRAFSLCGPVLWNRLPECMKEINSLDKFKKDLKTHLFKEAFG